MVILEKPLTKKIEFDDKKIKSEDVTAKKTSTLKSSDRVGDSIDPTNIVIQKKISELNAKHRVVFTKKIPAIEFIQFIDRKDTVLIAEDIVPLQGYKRFIVTKLNYLIDAITKKKYSLYEWLDKDIPVKLYIDVDLDEKVIGKIKDDDFDKYINKIHKLTCSLLKKNFKIENPRCIVLKSKNIVGKASAHLIYPDVVFDDLYCIKYMFFDCHLDDSLIRHHIIDPNVYKTGCFRFIFCSKLGKDNILEYYKGFDYEKPESDTDLFLDCMICNMKENKTVLSYEYKSKLKIPKTRNQKALKELQNMNTNQIASLDDIKYLLDNLNKSRADNYRDWIYIGIAIYNSNNTKEGFELWKNWSKLSDKYDENNCVYKWNSFNNNDFKANFHTLIYYLKIDNVDAYKKFNIKDDFKFDTIKVNKKYLLSEKDKDLVAKTAKNWIESDEIKLLTLMSYYGSGKTTSIKTLIKKYDPKTILWITHRQSLTLNLMGSFAKSKEENYNYDFYSYMDDDFNADRLICQIESLKHLITYNKKYDWIILDEIESLLYHFCSPTVQSPRETFNLFLDFIKNSKKVICMDGDIGERSYKFMQQIDKNLKIIENIYKPPSKKFIFTKNVTEFDLTIDKDIENGKNICIICMSANMANDYYQKYKNNYEIILHCSKSDDKLKQKLIDVNEFWSKYQVVVYSPSVSEGVDFNVENHIENIYIVLSQNSCSPRGLMQMLGRIRKPKSNIVNVYLNDIPFYENALPYNVNDVETLLSIMKNKCSSENNINIKSELYDTIVKYNELENLNKNRTYFTTVLLKLLERKGYTYEIDKDNINIEEDTKNVGLFAKNSIINAKDINEEKYVELLYKQKNNQAIEEDKLALEKFCYKVNWGEENIDMAFMKISYRKTHILMNLRDIYNGSDNKLITVDTNYIKYANMKNKEKMRVIKDFMNILGYDNLKEEKILSKTEFQDNMDKCIKESELFTKTNYTMPLFGMSKKNPGTIKSFLGFINTILNDYGLVISCVKKFKRYKGTRIINYYYKLHPIDNFLKYIDKPKNIYSENLLYLLEN